MMFWLWLAVKVLVGGAIVVGIWAATFYWIRDYLEDNRVSTPTLFRAFLLIAAPLLLVGIIAFGAVRTLLRFLYV